MRGGCRARFLCFIISNCRRTGSFRYFASLIERVAKVTGKLYLYHIPPIAIVPFSFSLIEALIADYPYIVAGIKDSSGHFCKEHTKELIERFARPGFDVFPGNESTLLAALRIGWQVAFQGLQISTPDRFRPFLAPGKPPKPKSTKASSASTVSGDSGVLGEFEQDLTEPVNMYSTRL